MTSTEPTGHDRRTAIRAALAASDTGWITTVQLAEMLEIDRATVYHHANRMVEQGTAAVGNLRRIGEPGRPAKVVIDPDRLPEIRGTFTLHEVNPVTGVTDEFTCQIEVTEAPDEYARPRVGPVTRALQQGADTDALAAAVAEQMASALLKDLRAGTIRLVIEYVGGDEATAASAGS